MIDSGRGELWSVILAAGASTRLGTPKQLLRLRSRTLLSHAAAAAQEVTPGRVLVVLGANALPLRLLLRRAHPHIRLVTNPKWADGLSGSLATGLSALPRRAGAALLLLCDQPGVDARALRRLVHSWRTRRGRAAAASYRGRLGVPAILPRALWAEACGLSGDAGARELLRKEGTVGRAVLMPEAAFDVDTPDELERLGAKAFRQPCSRSPR